MTLWRLRAVQTALQWATIFRLRALRVAIQWVAIFLSPAGFCALIAYQFPRGFWWMAGCFLCYMAFVFASYLSFRHQNVMSGPSVQSIGFSCGFILWWICAIALSLWLRVS
jgi:hypothetical protein